MKRFLTLLLTVAMTLTLCAFSLAATATPEPPPAGGVTVEPAGRAASLTVNAPAGTVVASLAAMGENVWLTTHRGEFYRGATADTIYLVDMLSGTLTEVFARETDDIHRFTPDTQGGIWAQTLEYDFGENGDAVTYKAVLHHIGPDGEVLAQMDVSNLMDETTGIVNLQPWEDGGVLVQRGIYNDASFILMDSTGNIVKTVALPHGAYSIRRLDDGTYIGATWRRDGGEADGMYMFTIDPEAETCTEIETQGDEIDYYESLLCGDGDTLWIEDTNAVYSYDRAANMVVRRFAWVDMGVYMPAGAFLRGGHLWAAEFVPDGSAVRVFSLRTEGDERQTLTLAAFYADDIILHAIAAFNRSNDDYRIALTDYGNTNSEDILQPDLTAFWADIDAGNVPDMVSVYDLPYDALRRQGLLADLTALIDADPEMDRDDFIPAHWDAVTVDGEILSLAPFFIVGTQWADPKDVTREDFTLERFIQMCHEDQPMYQFLDTPEVRSWAINDMLAANAPQFFDLEAGTCNFDSQLFRDLIQAYKDMGVDNYTNDDNRLNAMAIVSYEWMTMAEMIGGYTEPVGHPTTEGGKYAFLPRVELAMTTVSTAPEACWEFVRMLMTDEYQSMPKGVYQYSLPVRWSGLEKAEARDREENPELTQAHVSKLNKILAGDMYVSRSASEAEEILGIVDGELERFFTGAADIDTAVAAIQEKVSQYLAEQS